jgi:hypothetical protein
MKHAYCLFPILSIFVLCNTLVAQTEQQRSDEFLPRWVTPFKIPPSAQPSQKSWNPNVKKRPGHYTKKDWRNLIDSLWGPGISTTEKLKIFDDYWTMVDQTWGSFPNLVINWDSLKNVYRPEVAAGVSRGRFYGILSRLTRALNEWHVWTIDLGIDSTFGAYSGFAEHPNYPSYKYQPGIPIFNTNPTYFFRTNFGAGVTPLPDSTALVYSITPNHPLNLQPGDIILGYDRVPWKYLIKEILDSELPILFGGTGLASSPNAAFHVAMLSVGMNWGLYDTIDVYKFSTKDTVHFPTSLLKTIAQPYHIATEQLPVKGVAFPDLDAKKLVSWGVVEGTTIGYIYVLDWWGVPRGETKILFGQAVDELLHINNVSGLVIDFRTNFGGVVDYANDGFKQLFNFDPTNNFSRAIRIAGSDHNAFTFSPPEAYLNFTPGHAIFDRPIAVLTGPQGGSAGDYNAFRMRFHPMVRFFGKRTNGAYTNSSVVNEGIWYNSYSYRIDNGSVYSKYNNEGFMTHKSFPVDEEIWLTQAGVAKGEDGVVTRALEWINTLAYAHSPKADKTELNPNGDSVTVTAVVSNPLAHTISVSASLTDLNGVLFDSTQFFNDGLHGDETAADSVWGTILKTPEGQKRYIYSIRTDDKTQGTFREISYRNYLVSTKNEPAAPDIIYATQKGQTKGSLWSIGATAGTVSPLGEVFVPDILSLAIRPSTKALYGLSSTPFSSTLYRISCDSGATVPVRDLTVGDINAIAFSHPDTMYCGTSTGKLYRINFSSGEAVLVGAADNVNYWGLSFSPTSGKLWASARHDNDSIYIVNTSTGVAKSVGTIALFAIPRSLAFNSTGVLYCLIDNGSGEDYLATLDTLNGAATLISENPLSVSNLSAIAMRSDVLNWVSQEQNVQLPKTFSLSQNYPNPFNPSTVISYQLPAVSKVRLMIYDLLGREVATLVNEEQTAGWKEVQWNAKDVSSGIYFYTLEALCSTGNIFHDTKKLLYVK